MFWYGVSNFSALQNALSDEHGRIARNAIFYAFDLLYLDSVTSGRSR